MLIVSLSGYAQSGKDSTGNLLVQDFGFRRYSFADRLRECLIQLDPLVEAEGGAVRLTRLLQFTNGWDQAKVEYPEVRRLMQVFGTEVGRNLLGQNVWVDTLFRQLEEERPERAVITDCRFENEVRAVILAGGFPVWVKRPGVAPVNSHVSDNALTEGDCVMTVENDGSPTDLREKVAALAERLGF